MDSLESEQNLTSWVDFAEVMVLDLMTNNGGAEVTEVDLLEPITKIAQEHGLPKIGMNEVADIMRELQREGKVIAVGTSSWCLAKN